MNSTLSRTFRNHLGVIAAVATAAAVALALSTFGSGSGNRQTKLTLVRHQTAAHIHHEDRLRALEREVQRARSQARDVRLTISTVGVPSSTAPVYTTSHDGSAYDPNVYPQASTTSGGSCGGRISVNSVTSCLFASNVAATYFNQIGAGSGSVDAYSLATHRSYVMRCTEAPHECTGGDDAVVYFP